MRNEFPVLDYRLFGKFQNHEFTRENETEKADS